MRPYARLAATLSIALWVSFAAVRSSAAAEARKSLAIQAEVRTAEWKGQGWNAGEPLPDELRQAQAPEKFERFDTPAGQPPAFSGKVIGIPPGKTAQVGVVALIGTHWIKTENYKWTSVGPDGSFSIVADHKPDARKALLVAIAGRPWTFLRAEFAPRQSARDVELRIKEAKTIVLTMEDPGGKAVRGFKAEIFNAYVMADDAGKALRSQRLAAPTSSSGSIVLDVPPEPIGVLLAANRLAPYYTILDPRQADDFHFKMLAESRIRGMVTRNGQPVPGAEIFMRNPAAPLSTSVRKTDAQGKFDIAGRVPGTHDIHISDYRTSVQVQPGETAEVNIELGAAPPTTSAAR